MGHLHTKPGQYDMTVSAFIVKTNETEPKLLLHKHKKLNSWLQPGGHVELNENPWAALTHEIEEESGYLPEQLNVLQPTKHPAISSLENNIIHPIPVTIASHGFKQWPDHYHTDMTYGVTTTQHPAKQVEGTESNEFIWVTVKQLQNIPDTEILGSIREIGLQVLAYFVKNWYEIPFSTYKTNNPSFNSHTENV